MNYNSDPENSQKEIDKINNYIKKTSVIITFNFIFGILSMITLGVFIYILSITINSSITNEFFCYDDWKCPLVTAQNPSINGVPVSNCFENDYNDSNTGLAYCLSGNGVSVPCNTSESSLCPCTLPLFITQDEIQNQCENCTGLSGNGNTQKGNGNYMFGCPIGNKCLEIVQTSQNLNQTYLPSSGICEYNPISQNEIINDNNVIFEMKPIKKENIKSLSKTFDINKIREKRLQKDNIQCVKTVKKYHSIEL